MRIVFVIDPPGSLDAGTDTSVGLMHAAQDRGDEVWITEARLLEAVTGRARALARRVRLAPDRRGAGHRFIVADPWFTAARPRRIWLDEAGAVFMRLEPPVDGAYVAATLVLDLVDPERTVLVNDPRGLRLCSEHMSVLGFPDLVPPTLVTADAAAVREFVADHGIAVLKPVDGFAGRGVLRLEGTDPNLASLIEISTADGARAVIVQPYLPEVTTGNKRVFVVDGEPVGAVHRFPDRGDFRIGPPAAAAPLTARDREICARLAPSLRAHGLRMVGLDVIGTHLIEINVTCPGALRKADALLGWSLCADLLDRVLGAAAPRRAGTRALDTRSYA